MFCKNCGTEVQEGVSFCANCGTPVTAEAPVAAAPEAPAAAPKSVNSNLIRLIALAAAAVILIVGFVAILGGNSAKAVAKKYVKAQIEGDVKAAYGLMVGKMQKYVEEEVFDEYEDEMFDAMEEQCEEYDIKAKINNFNQYYSAAKKVNAAQMKEQYGKNYKVTIEIRDIENMRSSELEEIQEGYEDEDLEDYVKARKIKKGKIVTVKIIIDGKEDTQAYDKEIYVVKYGGQWKVADM